MRHKVFGNQLGRNKKQVKALYRSLILALLDHSKIETTLAKAKAVQSSVDKAINLAKNNSVFARRQLAKLLATNKKFDMSRFSDKNSGYTRIIRLGPRLSDSTEKVILELVGHVEPVKKIKETHAH